MSLYRANLLPHLVRPQLRCIDIPVQFLKMTNAPFVPPSMFDGAEQFAPAAIHSNLNASHWGLISQSSAFAQLIENFITEIGKK